MVCHIKKKKRYQKPVAVTLERQDDIKMSGQRHGFLGQYRLAADENGKILALDLTLYMNAGHSKDVSPIVSEAVARAAVIQSRTNDKMLRRCSRRGSSVFKII